MLSVCVGVGVGCARRTDQRTRDAFDSARGLGGADGGRDVVRKSGGGSGTFERDKIGWDRVSEVVENAVEIMRTSPDEQRFAELATAWCKIEPDPKRTIDGMVRVCNPDPPVVADGTAFSLEIGGEGVIGLVASDLTERDAQRVALDARETARRFCVEPFRNSESEDPASPDRASRPRKTPGEHEFHICPAQGGPLVAVSRFPRKPGDRRWMVAVIVLSPG